jgi:hypothetical protein
MVNPEPGAYEEKYPKKIFASGFPVSRVPWLPEAIKKPNRHGFGAALLHWLYFWVENFKKKCTTKDVNEKKSCIFPKIIL